MDDFSSRSASACQHRGESMKDPWSWRQNAPVKWITEAKGRYGKREANDSCTTASTNLTVMSACSHMRQEADRQLQLSFDKTDTGTAAQRGSISLKPQTDCEISWCLSAFPPLIRVLLHSFLLLNCAQIKIIPSWGYAKLTAYPSSLLCAAIFCSQWFSFLHHITQKGNLPRLQPPLVFRQALYLPVYRHSRLNTLSNRGCFLSKESLSGGGGAWIYCLNNILHPYTL